MICDTLKMSVSAHKAAGITTCSLPFWYMAPAVEPNLRPSSSYIAQHKVSTDSCSPQALHDSTRTHRFLYLYAAAYLTCTASATPASSARTPLPSYRNDKVSQPLHPALSTCSKRWYTVPSHDASNTAANNSNILSLGRAAFFLFSLAITLL